MSKDEQPSVPGGEVVVYEAPDGEVRVEVQLDRETVWLNQAQMAALFGRERSVITKHIRNVFGEQELEEGSNVQFLHIAGSDKPVGFYSLDVIVSVGYRVKSQRGTQFRMWATRTLREHLISGFTLNQRRLAERGLGEIEQTVALLSRTLSAHSMVTDEGRAVLHVVQQYTRAWKLLLEYDEERLTDVPRQPVAPPARLMIEDARATIDVLEQELASRHEAGSLFGRERGHGLAAILGAIEQTFGGVPLYPNAQIRAAHLLYFVIKDHPFSDGNKRIGTLLFLDYLRRNHLLERHDGTQRLADNAMVALALLIAESDPAQKELMIRLVLNLLGDETG